MDKNIPFTIQKKKWDTAEIDFARLLLINKPDIVAMEFPKWNFPDYDIKIIERAPRSPITKVTTYEIKNDIKARETENFVVEYAEKWNPSWIMTSKADYYVYLVRWEWRIQKRSELLARIISSDAERKTTAWWNNWSASMWKIPQTELPTLFDKLEVNEKWEAKIIWAEESPEETWEDRKEAWEDSDKASQGDEGNATEVSWTL